MGGWVLTSDVWWYPQSGQVNSMLSRFIFRDSTTGGFSQPLYGGEQATWYCHSSIIHTLKSMLTKSDRKLLRGLLYYYDEAKESPWEDVDGDLERLMVLGFVREEAFAEEEAIGSRRFGGLIQLADRYPLTLNGYEELNKNEYDRLPCI